MVYTLYYKYTCTVELHYVCNKLFKEYICLKSLSQQLGKAPAPTPSLLKMNGLGLPFIPLPFPMINFIATV